MALARLALSSGRTVALCEPRLSSTYGGMLEGYPFQRLNDLKLKHLLLTAEKTFPGRPVHLVTPPREYPDLAAGAFGPVELLPAVTCVGSFTSEPIDPANNPVLHRSALTVVWLQATLTVPGGDDAEPTLTAVPWEALAMDFEL